MHTDAATRPQLMHAVSVSAYPAVMRVADKTLADTRPIRSLRRCAEIPDHASRDRMSTIDVVPQCEIAGIIAHVRRAATVIDGMVVDAHRRPTDLLKERPEAPIHISVGHRRS